MKWSKPMIRILKTIPCDCDFFQGETKLNNLIEALKHCFIKELESLIKYFNSFLKIYK